VGGEKNKGKEEIKTRNGWTKVKRDTK